jgi:hypothetical protein
MIGFWVDTQIEFLDRVRRAKGCKIVSTLLSLRDSIIGSGAKGLRVRNPLAFLVYGQLEHLAALQLLVPEQQQYFVPSELP